MMAVAIVLFIFLILGKAKRILSFREILSGFIPFGALLVAGSLTFSVGKDYWLFIRNTTIYLMDLHTMGTHRCICVALLAICFLLQSILGKESYYESL
jgi:hypothetical protein